MNGPIKTTFCGIETVSCVTGLPVERLYELVESGHYLWVWNISLGIGSRRELRFWCREINHPAAVLNFTLNSAISGILPRRAKEDGRQGGLYNWEFRHLLRISRATMSGLRAELGVAGIEREFMIPRDSIENFLRRRWLGNILIRNCALKPDLIPRLAEKLCA